MQAQQPEQHAIPAGLLSALGEQIADAVRRVPIEKQGGQEAEAPDENPKLARQLEDARALVRLHHESRKAEKSPGYEGSVLHSLSESVLASAKRGLVFGSDTAKTSLEEKLKHELGSFRASQKGN